MSYKEHVDAVHQLKYNLTRRGFKAFIKTETVAPFGEGVVVSIVDPADPNDIFFARFLTWEELDVVNRGNQLFWRYVQ